MYLHLGEDIVVYDNEIIGIFDIENTSVSKITKDFLSGKNFEVVNVSYEIPKSFILTESKGNIKVYISNISPSTLRKRNNLNKNIQIV